MSGIVLARATVSTAMLFAFLVTGARAQGRAAPTDSVTVSLQVSDVIAGTGEFFSTEGLTDRSVGTLAGHAAAAFLAAQLRTLGFEPGGDDGSFLQRFEASSVAVTGTLVVGGAGRTATLPVGKTLVAWPRSSGETVTVDGELVFIGYGIQAPEHEWSDFNDAPLDGRIVVALDGDPGLSDTTQFYGRLGSPHALLGAKLAEAARRGASGFILLYDSLRSPRPWSDVVQSTADRLILSPRPDRADLAFAAIMPLAQFGELSSQFGRDVDVLVRRSSLPSFTPIALGMHAVMQLRTESAPITGINVVGKLPGRLDTTESEAVIVTTGYTDGDVDDEVSVGVLIGVAAALQSSATPPERTVYIVFTAGSGPDRVGARYLVSRPPVPLEHIRAVVGVGRPGLTPNSPVLAAIDGQESGLAPLLTAAATQTGIANAPWHGHPAERLAAPHAVFALEGVPSVTVGAAEPLREPALEHGLPSVQIQLLRSVVLARLARLVADSEGRPRWSAESAYRPAWERLERRRLRGIRP